MRRRSAGMWLTSLLAFTLSGCAAGSGTVRSTSNMGAAATADTASAQQIEAITAAAARPGFAGHYFQNGILYLAFDASGTASSRDLAGPSIRTVQVKYDLQELEAAEQRTLDLVNGNPAFGAVAVLIDKRRNGVLVNSVVLVGSASGGCRSLPPLPGRDPVNGVPIFDERDC